MGASTRTVFVCGHKLSELTCTTWCQIRLQGSEQKVLMRWRCKCSRPRDSRGHGRESQWSRASDCSTSANGGSMRRRGVFVGLVLAVLAGPEWSGVSMRAASDQQAQPSRTQPPTAMASSISLRWAPSRTIRTRGGVAAEYAALGHRVRFGVGGETVTAPVTRRKAADRHQAEAQEAGRRSHRRRAPSDVKLRAARQNWQ